MDQFDREAAREHAKSKRAYLMPPFILQAVLAFVTMGLAAAAIQKDRNTLRMAIDHKLPGLNDPKLDFHIPGTGPQNYPLTFVVLLMSIATFALDGWTIFAGFRGPISNAIYFANIMSLLLWLPCVIVGIVSFSYLGGPPSRAVCGYGESNLLDIHHNACATDALEQSWFISTCWTVVLTVVGIAVLSKGRSLTGKREDIKAGRSFV